MKNFNRSLIATLVAVNCSPVLAVQTSNNAQDDNNSNSPELETIIVTSQKHQQNLQEVPISVSVVKGETLERLNLTAMDDISKYLPGFDVKQTPSGKRIDIRGVGSGTNRGFEQSVGLFIDGIYAGRANQFAAPFYDIERIEILKGPQSVLFGKNTIAGAVNVQTALPSDAFEAKLSAKYETEYDSTKLGGYINGELVENLSARLVFQDTNTSDGYLTNTGTGADGITKDENLLRLSLLWQASDKLEILSKFEHSKSEKNGAFVQIAEFGNIGNEMTFKAFDPNVEDDIDLQTSQGSDLDDMSVLESDNASVKVTYQGDGWRAVSITGYSAYDYKNNEDADYSPVPIVFNDASDDFSQISQELRLEGESGDFEYAVGVYYQDQDYSGRFRFDLNSQIFTTALPNSASLRYFDQQSTSSSIFAQSAYQLSEAGKIIVGARYTKETKEAEKSHLITVYGEETPVASAYPAPVVGGLQYLQSTLGSIEFSYDKERDESHFTPSVTYQHTLEKNTMLYATASTGFKGGGFDVSDRSGLSIEFEEETAVAFELGGKSSFWDNRATVNYSIFSTQYEDLQVSAFDGILFITENAAEATTQGIEVDSRLQLTEDLYFSGAITLLNAEYDDYATAPCTAAQKEAHSGTGSCTQDLSGKSLAFAPDVSATLSLAYFTELSDNFELQSTINLNYKSDFYTASDLNEVSKQNAYSTIDLGLTLDHNSGWSVGLAVKNATDERAVIYTTGVPTFSGAYLAGIIPPRTVTISGSIYF